MASLNDVKPGKKPKATQIAVSKQWVNNYKKYYPLVESAAKKYELDPKMAFKTLLLESGAENNPTNLFQLMPGAITDTGMAGMDMSDPTVNTEAAMRYMKMLNNLGVPMEEIPNAWRVGKLGYDKWKSGTLKDKKAKDDLTTRLWWSSAADQFLNDDAPNITTTDIRPVRGADEGVDVTLPTYNEGIGSVIQRYLKNLLGF